jgi:hypothetical protein
MSDAVITALITGAITSGFFALMYYLLGPTPAPKKPPSPCLELIEKHQATGVPAHIQIKCREFLT